MRHQLTKTLGVRWRPGRTGGWEIAGIDNEVVREFSRRRNEIDDAIAELESAIGRHSNLEEVQRIITNTRPDKTDVDPSQLVEGWWTRARSHGLTPQRLSSSIHRDAVEQHVDIEFVFRRLADPIDGVCANISTFTRADVVAALVDLPVPSQDGPDQPLLLPADDIEHLADQFLASAAVIPLEPTDLPTESALSRSELFSTTEILSVQHRILTAYDAGLRAEAAVVSSEVMREAIEATTLTDEQAELVSSLCQSGHRVQCAIGRAGTGKTTSMRAASRAWEQSGWKVVGAAVKGEAARHLAEGAEIPTETVAWYLARRNRPSLPLDDRTVLIIDEASTLSDRDLDALLRVAADRGSIVRLIGDPAQHGAVAAGGMFGHLCGRNPDDTPELTTTHRLVDPAERNAVEALRLGDIDRAMDQLEAAGKLHIADDEIGLYIGMLQRWWGAHQVGDHHPMVDRRHHTRQTLNRLARQLLKSNGELGDTDIDSSRNRAFAVGDRVVSRMAARHLHVADEPRRYVRNGATGLVVEAVHGSVPAGDRLRIDFEGIGVVDIPRQFFDEHEGPGGRQDVGIDHAYAVTSYAVQGATFESSTSRIDEHASRAEAYVDLTRGRNANHLFLTRGPEPLDGEHLPKVPPPPLAQAVADRLKRSGPERPAIELDPIAATIAASAGRPDDVPAVAPPTDLRGEGSTPRSPRPTAAADQRPPRDLGGPVPLSEATASARRDRGLQRMSPEPRSRSLRLGTRWAGFGSIPRVATNRRTARRPRCRRRPGTAVRLRMGRAAGMDARTPTGAVRCRPRPVERLDDGRSLPPGDRLPGVHTRSRGPPGTPTPHPSDRHPPTRHDSPCTDCSRTSSTSPPTPPEPRHEESHDHQREKQTTEARGAAGSTQPLAKRLLTVKETSEILGVSRSTIYELIASDDLEVVRIGRSLRVPTAAVDDFVDRLRSRRAS